jgi:hypothetical protein
VRPLWREDGSAICSEISQWSESRRTWNHTLLSHLRLPQPGGPGSHIYIPQEHGGPVIPPGTGFPLLRLLRFAFQVWGLRSRYDWWSGSQYVLASSPTCDLRPDINSVWISLCCLCCAPSLTRGWICVLSVTVINNWTWLNILSVINVVLTC